MYLSPLLKRYPKTDPNEPNWRRPVLVLMILVFTLSLLPYIYTGIFSRYQADDFCVAASGANYFQNPDTGSDLANPFIGFSTRWVSRSLEPLVVIGSQILPGILVIGLMGGIYLLLFSIKIQMGWSVGKTEIWILAGIASFFMILSAPAQHASFFWRSGSIPFTLPVVLLPFFLWFQIKTTDWMNHNGKFAASCLVTFLSALLMAGFSETAAVFQTALFAIIFIYLLIRSSRVDHRKPAILSGLALAGSVVGLVILIVSENQVQPGPAVIPGFQQVNEPYSIPLDAIFTIFKGMAVPYLISYGLSFMLAILNPDSENMIQKWRPTFWMIPSASLILAAINFFTVLPNITRVSELNRIFPASWILMTGGMATFYLLGNAYATWRQKDPGYKPGKTQSFIAFLVVMICFYPMLGALTTLGRIPQYQVFAGKWDARDTLINSEKASGNLDVSVEMMEPFQQLEELSADPEYWVNQCSSAYYGVKNITVR